MWTPREGAYFDSTRAEGQLTIRLCRSSARPTSRERSEVDGDPEHRFAKQKGRELWYSRYMMRICRVEREYGRPD